MSKKTVRDIFLAGAVTMLLWSTAKADPVSRPDGSDLSTLSAAHSPGDRAERITAEPEKDRSKVDRSPRELPAIGERPSPSEGAKKSDTMGRTTADAAHSRPNALGMENRLNEPRLDSDDRGPFQGHNPDVND